MPSDYCNKVSNVIVGVKSSEYGLLTRSKVTMDSTNKYILDHVDSEVDFSRGHNSLFDDETFTFTPLEKADPLSSMASPLLCGSENLSGPASQVYNSISQLSMESIEHNNRDSVLTCITDEELMPPPDSSTLIGRHVHDEMTSLSSYSPLSSPEVLSPRSRVASPEPFMSDSNTQMSLIQEAADLNLDSNSIHALDSSMDSSWLYPTTANSDTAVDEEIPRKSQRCSDNEGPHSPENSNNASAANMDGFDLSGAISSSQFIFTKFGCGVPGVFETTNNTSEVSCDGATIEDAPQVSDMESSFDEPLSAVRPSKRHGIELKVLRNPEVQHRARYLTEGSRGAVKDHAGTGHPVVKLIGYNQKATLQVFVGTDSGNVKPHGFYQACKVCSKNSTQCIERTIDGTTVIEVDFEPDKSMEICLDCVGILKLRNADVEQRIGIAKSKKKSTKARLIYRVKVKSESGTDLILQTASSPILCTQPVGQPEICKQSLDSASVEGGDEMFIIGKNFMKGTKVIFQELRNEKVFWEKEAEILPEYFHSSHLIAIVPKYVDETILNPVSANVFVQCGERIGESRPFEYRPVTNDPAVQQQKSLAESRKSSAPHSPAANPATTAPLEVKVKLEEVRKFEERNELNMKATTVPKVHLVEVDVPMDTQPTQNSDQVDCDLDSSVYLNTSIPAAEPLVQFNNPTKVTEMDTSHSPSVNHVKPLQFSISPVALELNKLIQETQQKTSQIFQLPAGIGLPTSSLATTVPVTDSHDVTMSHDTTTNPVQQHQSSLESQLSTEPQQTATGDQLPAVLLPNQVSMQGTQFSQFTAPPSQTSVPTQPGLQATLPQSLQPIQMSINSQQLISQPTVVQSLPPVHGQLPPNVTIIQVTTGSAMLPNGVLNTIQSDLTHPVVPSNSTVSNQCIVTPNVGSISSRAPMLASLLTRSQDKVVTTKKRHNSGSNKILPCASNLPTISVQDVDEVLFNGS
ncbi:uncharacterized protein LOC141902539 [Tubulanus polymorphus]|uniref:uncharacterized protein LOC141902539 n=1 Tax=Tubulanus polymorphus TaxID=672921 RepID=UPI003DA477BB